MMADSAKYILIFLLLTASCKSKEVYYTPEEAKRIADSVTAREIERITREAELNLEYRKRVETPYLFGIRTGEPVKNPYDTTNYSSTKRSPEMIEASDSTNLTDSVQEKTIDPKFKRMQ